MIDEIQISEGLHLYPSTGCVIGTPNLHSSNGSFDNVATHGLVFFVGGVSTRWKLIVGYHFTGSSICPTKLKETVFEIIRQRELVGILVHSLVYDMGPQNLAFWKECSVMVKKNKARKTKKESNEPACVDIPNITVSLKYGHN